MLGAFLQENVDFFVFFDIIILGWASCVRAFIKKYVG